jgi:hypothetical protein
MKKYKIFYNIITGHYYIFDLINQKDSVTCYAFSIWGKSLLKNEQLNSFQESEYHQNTKLIGEFWF